MCPYAIFEACALDTFPQALYIWDDNVSHTGSSPWSSSCLAVVTESIAVLHWVTNMSVVNLLPVTIYYFVLYRKLNANYKFTNEIFPIADNKDINPLIV